MLFNKFKNQSIVFIHDLFMIIVAWLGAYWLRFNLSSVPPEYLQQATQLLPYIILIQGGTYWLFGLYRGIWRFASLPDVLRILKAVLVGVALNALVLFLLPRGLQVPRSIFILYGLLLGGLLGGSRFSYRWLKDHRCWVRHGKRVLLVGAGEPGEAVVRSMQRDANKQYHPILFVDDDAKKHGQEIQGIRVIGFSKDIPLLVKQFAIELIIIALPSAKSYVIQRVVEYCETTKVPFQIIPEWHELTSGKLSIATLRNVLLEDLLGREPVSLDWQSIHQGLLAKTVLVTGGGGSIGSELCRQIALIKPERLIILEQSEFNLYKLTLELTQDFPQLAFYGYLGDVNDVALVGRLLDKYRPDVIFHAAAYKHVPLLENQIRSAVYNNILGTQVIAQAAAAYEVPIFVQISTDKVVNPTNIMGATKRVAELLCQNFNSHSQTKFITVRFGNVLGSAGSVVPLFRQQLERGGPITVTHPDITRFFMTIPEAAQLILQSTVMAKGGEIFVLDMGEPIKISFLAEQLIRLSGKQPGNDIKIIYTGLRPGEKLHEELFHEQEELIATNHQKILQASYREIDWVLLNQILDDMKQACGDYAEEDLYRLLTALVPEYNNANK